MARLAVSGTLNPDASTADTGEPAGEFNSAEYWSWTNDGGTWYLWYDLPNNKWVISDSLGVSPFLGQFGWGLLEGQVVGAYSMLVGVTGIATVAEYVAPTPDEYITVRWRASGEFTVLKMR